MQNIKSKLVLAAGLIALSLSFFSNAAGKIYTENEFLDNFNGKSKKVVIDKLGAPIKKQLAVKPTNAGSVIGKNVEGEKAKSRLR